jgi:hypothetical protein
MRAELGLACLSFGLFVGTAKADPIVETPATATQNDGDTPEVPPTLGDQANAAVAASPAPPRASKERTAKNVLYVEGLGPGLFYSLDYERMLGDFSARIGFSYLSFSASESSATGREGASASAGFLAIPLMVNYLGVGSVQNMLELGVGATILHVGAGANTFGTGSDSSGSASATYLLPVCVVGYRFQPADGGFVFRAGLSPLLAGHSIPLLPLPYVALGGAFGP